MKKLFQLGEFTLHSGKKSNWKIDCDSLTDEDLECLAWIVVNELKLRFHRVISVPTGGNRFACKLGAFRFYGASTNVLIVDDVLTTGDSMQRTYLDVLRKGYCDSDIIGVVIFARGKCPEWIRPIFQM